MKHALHFAGLELTRFSPELAESPIDKSLNLTVFGEFRSSRNERFQLLRGYRAKTWGADWNTMTKERAQPSPEVVRRLGLLKKGRDQTEILENFLVIHGTSVKGKTILEVGCFDGAGSYALLEKGARRVIAIDLPRGFVTSVNPTSSEVEKSSIWLDTLRKEVRHEFEFGGAVPDYNTVVFRNEDVCDINDISELDLILSSATLEHIIDFPTAFRKMFAALKPGGYSLHQYHPFFCASGAHFDTLDFPWGHVRLPKADFKRYILENRPDEKEISEYRFFNTLNRMTINDMANAATEAGFLIEDIILSSEDWRNLDPIVLRQGREIYPNLCVRDLISTGVLVLMRKPFVLGAHKSTTGKSSD